MEDESKKEKNEELKDKTQPDTEMSAGQTQNDSENKNKSISIKSIITLVVVIVLAAVAMYGFRMYKINNDSTRKAQQLADLEEYYSQGNYVGMNSYLDNKVDKNYTDSFIKYSRVGTAYKNKEIVMDWLKRSLDSDAASGSAAQLPAAYLYTFQQLSILKSYEEAGFPYDEGDAILGFEKEYTEILTETCHLTEAEITASLAKITGGEKNSDFEELANLTLARVK